VIRNEQMRKTAAVLLFLLQAIEREAGHAERLVSALQLGEGVAHLAQLGHQNRKAPMRARHAGGSALKPLAGLVLQGLARVILGGHLLR